MPVQNADRTVTLTQFARIMRGAEPGVLEAWYPEIAKSFLETGVAPSDIRQAAALASAANETGAFRVFDEASYINTPYSRIREVFGSSAPSQSQVDQWRLLGRPAFDENFFNWVYDDAHRPPGYRLGNVHPGDGWKYRGMGPNATTGLGNYLNMARKCHMPELVDHPELVKTPAVGAKIMGVFWVDAGCNELVDDGSEAGFLSAMRRLNAGLHDFSHHLSFWHAAKAALANDDVVEPGAPILLDDRRAAVMRLQRALSTQGFDTKGIDGVVGPATKAAILAFQAQHAPPADGIVGPKTLKALGLAA